MDLGSTLDAREYGGKAANLSAALRNGLPVPEGLALSWRDVEVIASDMFDREEPPTADLGVLATVSVAVRSSAVGEDSMAASFAGQHLTVLNVIGEDAVLDAIRRVWGSGRDEAALAYRRRMELSGDARVGVVVQQLVKADVAGVLFTCDPVSGTDDRWVIEASWGLGEAVVAGLVQPDHYVVTPSGDLLAAKEGTKNVAVMPDPGGGTSQRTVEKKGLCLDQAAVKALVDLAAACEQLFGPGQDVEWAFAMDRPWLLQSRPVTT